MTFPPGRYVTLEGIEMSPHHVLEVSTDFEVVHSRACVLRDNTPGALICIMVMEDAEVITYRNGRIIKIIKERKGKNERRT